MSSQQVTEKSGSQVMIDILLANKIDVCWGYPGGAILPFYDTLYRSSLKHMLVRHEQAAAHAAEGYAKASGHLGVCIATSGPGATNLMTGIADAKMDSVPILAITGQVPTMAIGTDAFQEVDTYGMSIPITKYNALIKSADQVARITQEAIVVSLSRRQGPSLIDFPKDCQTSLTRNLEPGDIRFSSYHYKTPQMKGDVDQLITYFNRSQRPLLYVGGGAISSESYQNIHKLAEKTQTPVVSTLMALGAFPGNHRLSLGMMGMHGTAYANKAILECDFILALGARFDDRVALNASNFAENAIKAQIDIDPAEINKRVDVNVHIEGDLNEVLNCLLKNIKRIERKNWVSRIDQLKEENPLRFNQRKDAIKPQYLIRRLWELTKGDAIIATDVGQHQMWAAQYYLFNEPRKWITSGGLGTMGFGFPAALGAKIAKPDEEVILISGDGSFQMCMQELATARMYNISVKILLFNNGFLGMVRQWQELFYDNHFSESGMSYNPDFVKIASGFDIPAKCIAKLDELEKGLQFLIETKDCCILEVTIPESEKVYPMISSGSKYEDMVDYDHQSEEGTPFSLIPNKEKDIHRN